MSVRNWFWWRKVHKTLHYLVLRNAIARETGYIWWQSQVRTKNELNFAWGLEFLSRTVGMSHV